MAYQQQNNNQQQRRKPQPKIKNPDPMSNTRDMGRYGIRIMRDIAKGKFNYSNDANVFSNNDFIMATIRECEKRIKEANIHIAAIQFTYANTTDQDVKDLLARDMKVAEVYNLIRDTLMMIINNCGDTRYLNILMNRLPKYRYIL